MKKEGLDTADSVKSITGKDNWIEREWAQKNRKMVFSRAGIPVRR
jgi:hypothetical protein